MISEEHFITINLDIVYTFGTFRHHYLEVAITITQYYYVSKTNRLVKFITLNKLYTRSKILFKNYLMKIV